MTIGKKWLIMKKLLHERLRDKELFLDYPEIANFIADEIEHYYMSLPCDSDGKPWKIGDAGRLKDEIKVIIRGYYGGTTLVLENENGVMYTCDVDELKRPQPKVLDADGVEIKVGDTVWHIPTGKKYTAESIYTAYDGDILVKCTAGGLNVKNLTHKEPDSLEKLRDDMLNYWNECENEEDNRKEWASSEWADRLTALIERDV